AARGSRAARARKGRAARSVPAGEDRTSDQRGRPVRPVLVYLGAPPPQERAILFVRYPRQAEDALALEIARFGHAKQGRGARAVLFAQRVGELPRGPEEEGAFLPLAVRVGRRPERATRIGHLAGDVLQHVGG